MDFRDSEEQAAFRARLRDWLTRTVASLDPPPADGDGVGRLERFRNWQQRVFEAGYAGLAWPREYGGRGAGVLERAMWAEETDRAGAPEPLNVVGEGLVGPVLIEHGTADQRIRFLRPILEGEEIWCQLFSEPAAGSDLAALQTRAEPADGGWRITGQKVWTSRAQLADHAILLARTAPERYDGISCFLLPMRQPGVESRPLTQITGVAEFNEVFLDGAFVPKELILGEEGQGWALARAILQHERANMALGRFSVQRWVDELIETVRERGLADDPVIRGRIAELHGRARAHGVTALRAISVLSRGAAPGPESSVGKLYLGPLLEDIADLGVEVGGPGEVLARGAVAEPAGLWERRALFARGMRLAGGTPNIQRNIIADRILGLPR